MKEDPRPEFFGEMLDITAPEAVQIQIDSSGSKIWINVDGVCRLRICQIKENLILEDQRRKNEKTKRGETKNGTRLSRKHLHVS